MRIKGKMTKSKSAIYLKIIYILSMDEFLCYVRNIVSSWKLNLKKVVILLRTFRLYKVIAQLLVL